MDGIDPCAGCGPHGRVLRDQPPILEDPHFGGMALQIMFQKFCKELSRGIGHGKSIGFGSSHSLNRKGRHHDRDTWQIEKGSLLHADSQL